MKFSIVLVLALLFLLAFRVQWGAATPPPFRAVPAKHTLADILHPQRRARQGRDPLDILFRHGKPRP